MQRTKETPKGAHDIWGEPGGKGGGRAWGRPGRPLHPRKTWHHQRNAVLVVREGWGCPCDCGGKRGALGLRVSLLPPAGRTHSMGSGPGPHLRGAGWAAGRGGEGWTPCCGPGFQVSYFQEGTGASWGDWKSVKESPEDSIPGMGTRRQNRHALGLEQEGED